MTLVLWGIRIRRRDSVISVMLWKPGVITRRTNPKSRGGKSETEKAEDSFSRLLKQQKEQLALAGQNTELAKLKYQTAQGELKTLTEMQKQELLRNAALIDQQKIREQLRSREETLKNDNVAARASNEAELLGIRAGRTSQGTHAGVAADPRQLPPEGCGPSVSVSDRGYQ